MKIRMIKLTPKFLMEALQGKTSDLVTSMPSDAELLDLKYDLLSRQILAIVRSDAFEDIADVAPIPELNLNAAASSKTTPFASPGKLDAKSTATGRPEPVPVKTVAPKKNTSLMEEEFSLEQRKLLSFSINGNYVIVKPIKFLKAEWDDINEVVRSIGGRWVKGDIISYWEIPVQ
jgi:hypothetical protein